MKHDTSPLSSLITDLPNTLKSARQNATLGSYSESLRLYKRVLDCISNYMSSIQDPFMREEWKKANDEIKKENQNIANIIRALKNFPIGIVDVPKSPIMKVNQAKENINTLKNDQCKIERQNSSMKDTYSKDSNIMILMPKMKTPIETTKKDPDVWDPPSPHQESKKRPQVKLPNWAKPGPIKHKQKIGGGGVGSGCMSGMGGTVNYKYIKFLL